MFAIAAILFLLVLPGARTAQAVVGEVGPAKTVQTQTRVSATPDSSVQRQHDDVQQASLVAGAVLALLSAALGALFTLAVKELERRRLERANRHGEYTGARQLSDEFVHNIGRCLYQLELAWCKQSSPTNLNHDAWNVIVGTYFSLNRDADVAAAWFDLKRTLDLIEQQSTPQMRVSFIMDKIGPLLELLEKVVTQVDDLASSTGQRTTGTSLSAVTSLRQRARPSLELRFQENVALVRLLVEGPTDSEEMALYVLGEDYPELRSGRAGEFMNPLIVKGYVRKEVDDVDSIVYGLTDKGRDLYGQAQLPRHGSL